MKNDTSYYDSPSWDTVDEHNSLIIEFRPYEVIKALDVSISMDDYSCPLPIISSLPISTSQDDI